MNWPVFFPNVKIKSTKDLIIRLLTEQKEMTNQSLFMAIKKKFGISVTYQAVRQALTELTIANVLTKNKKFYSVSIKWIKSLNEFSHLLKKKYVDDFDIKIIDEKTKEIELNSLYDLGHFILYSFNDHFFDIDKKMDLYMLLICNLIFLVLAVIVGFVVKDHGIQKGVISFVIPSMIPELIAMIVRFLIHRKEAE